MYAKKESILILFVTFCILHILHILKKIAITVIRSDMHICAPTFWRVFGARLISKDSAI